MYLLYLFARVLYYVINVGFEKRLELRLFYPTICSLSLSVSRFGLIKDGAFVLGSSNSDLARSMLSLGSRRGC